MFIELNSAPSWNSTPNRVRISYSSLAEHSMMFVPSIRMELRSGRSRPISDFWNTDLPVPDGPSMTLTSPVGISNVTSSPNHRRAEGLRQSVYCNWDAHSRSFPCATPRRVPAL